MIITMKAAQLSRWISFGSGVIRRIMGYNPQSADIYLQLFETSNETSSIVVSNGKIPTLGSLLCASVDGFIYDFGQVGLTFKELCIALSSTQASLTAVGANAGLDMTLDVTGDFLVDNYVNETLAGDLTNLVNSLQVWAEVDGPKNIARLDVVAGVGTINWLVGYAVNTPTAQSKVQFAIPVNGTGAGNFGFGGFTPFEKTPDQVLHQGLTVQAQATPVAQANTGQTFACRAIMI